MIQFQESPATDGRKDGRKDGQALLYRTLQATAAAGSTKRVSNEESIL